MTITISPQGWLKHTQKKYITAIYYFTLITVRRLILCDTFQESTEASLLIVMRIWKFDLVLGWHAFSLKESYNGFQLWPIFRRKKKKFQMSVETFQNPLTALCPPTDRPSTYAPVVRICSNLNSSEHIVDLSFTLAWKLRVKVHPFPLETATDKTTSPV